MEKNLKKWGTVIKNVRNLFKLKKENKATSNLAI